MRPKIVVISTGGTIAMRHDAAKKGDVPAVEGRLLVEAVPALEGVAAVEVVEFDNIPSFHMTPAIMLRLAVCVEKALARDDVHGAVITHGTDTLEETAFFLDQYLPAGKPVCLTGAMRTGSHIAPDGPYNIHCAVRTAASPAAVGYGALVVMNGEIHAARYVTKMHTSDVATFASPYWGPIGHVDEDVILLRPGPTRRRPLRPESLAPRVPVLKIYTGMDVEILDALMEMGMDAIVLEGFGRGNFPASIAGAVSRMLQAGIPVVAASRVPNGRTLGVYAAEGGAAHLRSLGVILSGSLSSQKARLLTMLALAAGEDSEGLATRFREEEAAPSIASQR